MNATEILTTLTALNLKHEVLTHPPVRTVEAALAVTKTATFTPSKTLFLTAKGKDYLLMVPATARFSNPQFRRETGLPRLSFGSPAELKAKLGTSPGIVSPLVLLANPAVPLYVDHALLESDLPVGCHPNSDTQTVLLNLGDLLATLKERGVEVHTGPYTPDAG